MSESNEPLELTEDFVADRTDIHLGTVVLRATQVRMLIRQNNSMKKILHDACLILRALEANGDNDATHLLERIGDVA